MSAIFKKPRPLGSASRELEIAVRHIHGLIDEGFGRFMANPPYLYHFTSLKIAREILRSGVLLAHDLIEVRKKEPTEMIYACGVLRKALASVPEFLVLDETAGDPAEALLNDGICVACFSTEDNQELQWVDYGKNHTGCAIAFHSSGLIRLARQKGAFSFPMVYESNTQLDILVSVLRTGKNLWHGLRPNNHDAFKGEVIRALAALISAVKNPAHCTEREWRLSVHRNSARFRAHPTMGSQYRVLKICTAATVSGLLLGPDCTMSISEGEKLLADLGYAAVARRVSKSELVRL